MNEKAQALLLDIVRLLSKHDTDAFELLARELRSGGLVDNLTQVLEGVATEVAPCPVTTGRDEPARQRSPTISEVIKSVARRDPEKARLITEFRDALSAGTCLPRLRDIQHFAEDSGFRPTNAKSRATAVSHLLRGMSELPREKLRSLISDANQVSAPG